MSTFALPIPPANFSIDLRRLTERSSTASGDRLQETGFSYLLIYTVHLAFGRFVGILLAMFANVLGLYILGRTGISPIHAFHLPIQLLFVCSVCIPLLICVYRILLLN